MSLAEELLADFEDEDEELVNLDSAATASQPDDGSAEGMDVDSHSFENVSSVKTHISVYGSEGLAKLMAEIDKRLSGKNADVFTNKSQVDGPIESHPEYLLIVESNNMSVAIDNEITDIYKFVKEKYSKRFPELESLMHSPLDYMMTARELGNDLSRAKNNKKLQEFLIPATLMIVTVSSTTTTGKQLTEQELEAINEACDIGEDLNRLKSRILAYVESRMSFIAPNLSAIVGPNIAAKLMGAAGGLTALSKMPACNLEVLGSQKKSLQGFSTKQVMPHTGFVFHSVIVENTPPDLRRKAASLVAYKSSLACRIDATHSQPDGSVGQAFREKIEKALEKKQEAAPVKQVKALPAPIDEPGKKRGGKRVRRMKERMAMTEFRKQANRMNFGEIEDDAYQEDLGFSAGVLGKSGKGRIRAPQIDEKTKARISKALQKNLQKQQAYGGTTTIKKQISGTASSVAFTPLQGLEIVNPQAAEAKVNEANAKYFSNTTGFMSVTKKT